MASSACASICNSARSSASRCWGVRSSSSNRERAEGELKGAALLAARMIDGEDIAELPEGVNMLRVYEKGVGVGTDEVGATPVANPPNGCNIGIALELAELGVASHAGCCCAELGEAVGEGAIICCSSSMFAVPRTPEASMTNSAVAGGK